MRYYLAYGSNLNKVQMARRCPDAVCVGTAIIKDYRLMFKGSFSGSYLTIEKEKGQDVPVGVWLVSEDGEKALDIYEGYPDFYYKKEMDVEMSNKAHIKAFVYIMDEKRRVALPSRYYFDTCLRGYEDFNLDKKYLIKALDYSMKWAGVK